MRPVLKVGKTNLSSNKLWKDFRKSSLKFSRREFGNKFNGSCRNKVTTTAPELDNI